MKTLWLKIAATSFVAALLMSGCGGDAGSSASGSNANSNPSQQTASVSGSEVNQATGDNQAANGLPRDNGVEVEDGVVRDVLGRTFFNNCFW